MYFTFNSIVSTTKGIVTESMGWFIKPLRRNDQSYVEGKDGSVTTEYGYDSIVVPAVIGLTDLMKLDEVIAYLDGTGVLICSDDPLKYRTAKVLEQVDYERLLRFKKANVAFLCDDPLRYILGEATQTVTSFPATVANIGTVISKPLLKVTGSGTIILVLNGVTMSYIFPTGETYFYIDCDSGETYYNLPGVFRNRSMTLTGGTDTVPFPTLALGNNTLFKTSGTVSEIIVTKRTRYL